MMTKCASKYEAKGHGKMDKARAEIAAGEKAQVTP
jgi:hypothetical protein